VQTTCAQTLTRTEIMSVRLEEVFSFEKSYRRNDRFGTELKIVAQILKLGKAPYAELRKNETLQLQLETGEFRVNFNDVQF